MMDGWIVRGREREREKMFGRGHVVFHSASSTAGTELLVTLQKQDVKFSLSIHNSLLYLFPSGMVSVWMA